MRTCTCRHMPASPARARTSQGSTFRARPPRREAGIPACAFPLAHSRLRIPAYAFPLTHSRLRIPACAFPLTHSHLRIPAYAFPLTHSRLRIPACAFPLTHSRLRPFPLMHRPWRTPTYLRRFPLTTSGVCDGGKRAGGSGVPKRVVGALRRGQAAADGAEGLDRAAPVVHLLLRCNTNLRLRCNAHCTLGRHDAVPRRAAAACNPSGWARAAPC